MPRDHCPTLWHLLINVLSKAVPNALLDAADVEDKEKTSEAKKEYETINKAKALWTMSKKDISNDD